jgi:hypothetical protein
MLRPGRTFAKVDVLGGSFLAPSARVLVVTQAQLMSLAPGWKVT